MIQSILIANRGEIACRIIRTARRLGIRTVAVYSEADKNALHVRQADEAYYIGPGPAAESYLNGARIIEVALQAKVDAIHPGYGFLSENSDFVEACQQKKLIFIGPPVKAMQLMGSKQGAKAYLEPLKIPLVPGYHGDNQQPEHLAKEAKRVGFPLLIKASAGGGGRGMRVVETEKDFLSALEAAKKESLRNFADDKVILERYIRNPKHIEIQIFADQAGHCIHLGERECSIQRRHQKLIEETPSPFITPKQRDEMGATAVKIGQAIGYVGAGTIEFIVDTDQPDFTYYFMEMNTRLQVEHPVTEMVTGFDLVEWQILVASGQNLPAQQKDVHFNGHAIEARLYAEDPSHDFAPSIGALKTLHLPLGVRCDIGYDQGDRVSPFYDSMLMKVIVHAPQRLGAIQKLHDALAQLLVQGVITNNSFLRSILAHPDFMAGTYTTTWVEHHFDHLLPATTPANDILAIAALIVAYQRQHENPQSPWCHDGWTINEGSWQKITLKQADQIFACRVQLLGEKGQVIIGQGQLELILQPQTSPYWLVTLGGKEARILAVSDEDEILVQTQDDTFIFAIDRPELHDHDLEASDHELKAPMPGQITAIYIEPGMNVQKGMILLTMEAMKMEHKIIAPADGVVEALYCQVGDQVTEGMDLVHWESRK